MRSKTPPPGTAKAGKRDLTLIGALVYGLTMTHRSAARNILGPLWPLLELALVRAANDGSPHPVLNDLSRAWRAANKPKKRKYGGSKSHAARARKWGGAVERVNPLKVFARDGWLCQVCGKATPKARRGSWHADAPELDHRIPLVSGGGHTYANVQTACRACNLKKGGGSAIGQLPLWALLDIKGEEER